MNSSKRSLDFASNRHNEVAQLSDIARPAPAGIDAVGGSQPRTKQNRLDSWKEIAAYLQRETRTVQRWEKSEGLPVHRHYHQKTGTVFAFKEEIDAWSHSRASLPSRPPKSSYRNGVHAFALSPNGISKGELPIDANNPAGELTQLPNLSGGFVPAIIYLDSEIFSRELISIRRNARHAIGGSLASQNAFLLGGVRPPRTNSRARRRTVSSEPRRG